MLGSEGVAALPPVLAVPGMLSSHLGTRPRDLASARGLGTERLGPLGRGAFGARTATQIGKTAKAADIRLETADARKMRSDAVHLGQPA